MTAPATTYRSYSARLANPMSITRFESSATWTPLLKAWLLLGISLPPRLQEVDALICRILWFANKGVKEVRVENIPLG